jgi:hypothetical protein
MMNRYIACATIGGVLSSESKKRSQIRATISIDACSRVSEGKSEEIDHAKEQQQTINGEKETV